MHLLSDKLDKLIEKENPNNSMTSDGNSLAGNSTRTHSREYGSEFRSSRMTSTFRETFVERLLSITPDAYNEDEDQIWTKRLMVNYNAVSKRGNEGDIPIQEGFANGLGFWKMIFIGCLLGIFIGLFSIIFMNVAEHTPVFWVDNNSFADPADCGFYKGSKQWIWVTTGAGLLVGLGRYFAKLPDQLPGLFKEINECHVNPENVLYTVAISMISLAGGANLGPEAGLANLGGGVATWLVARMRFDDADDGKLIVLSGMTSALGALFPTPILAVLMIFELGKPPKSFMESTIVLSFAAIVSFSVYYALIDRTYLEHYSDNSAILSAQWLEQEGFQGHNCTTGFIIGIVSAFISFYVVVSIGFCKQIFTRIRLRIGNRNKFLAKIIPPVIGGLIIGSVNYVLPLTVGSGSMVVSSVVKYGGQSKLSTHLLLCSAAAKIFLLGVSMNCGFIGGFIFPQIAVAMMSGCICFQLYGETYGLSLGLCVGCFLSGLPSAIVPMPFTLSLLSIFVFYFGLYQTAPIFMSAITSYTIICGSGLFAALANRSREKQEALDKLRQSNMEVAMSENFHEPVKSSEGSVNPLGVDSYLAAKQHLNRENGEVNPLV
jgi:H+/Cl- antiporter ClcA